jgi:hypothetical protein
MKKSVSLLLLALCSGSIAVSEEIEMFAPDGKPFALEADRIQEEESGNLIATGRIEARHGNVIIRCMGQATVYVSHGNFSAIEAHGLIEADTDGKKLWSNRLFYDEPRRLLTLSGNPRALEGKTRYSAEKRILCYTETGVMKFEPRARITIDNTRGREKSKPRRKKFLGLF